MNTDKINETISDNTSEYLNTFLNETGIDIDEEFLGDALSKLLVVYSAGYDISDFPKQIEEMHQKMMDRVQEELEED